MLNSHLGFHCGSTTYQSQFFELSILAKHRNSPTIQGTNIAIIELTIRNLINSFAANDRKVDARHDIPLFVAYYLEIVHAKQDHLLHRRQYQERRGGLLLEWRRKTVSVF